MVAPKFPGGGFKGALNSKEPSPCDTRPFTAEGPAEARLIFSLSGAEPDCLQGPLPELWPRLLPTFHINVARWPAYENVCQGSVKRVSLARILLLI